MEKEIYVLVVDDDEMNAELVSNVASNIPACEGRVRSFTRGKDLIEDLQNFNGETRLVISDLEMPGMSGVDVLLKAREISPPGKVRCILLTGCEDAELHEKSRADCVIIKPFRSADLIKSILEII